MAISAAHGRKRQHDFRVGVRQHGYGIRYRHQYLDEYQYRYVVGGGNFAFSMNADGIMTDSVNTSFYGVMSMDKSMIVATDTNSGGHPEIWVMMKTTTATTRT